MFTDYQKSKESNIYHVPSFHGRANGHMRCQNQIAAS